MTENDFVSSLRSAADALKGADGKSSLITVYRGSQSKVPTTSFVSTELTRKDLASGEIPDLIVKALRIAGESSLEDGSSNDYTLQAARVAANLVVDDGRSPSMPRSFCSSLVLI